MKTRRGIFHLTIIRKIVIYISFTSIFLLLVRRKWQCEIFSSLPKQSDILKEHQNIIMKYYEPRKKWKMSNLGTYLFKHGTKSDAVIIPNRRKPDVFHVLVWMHWQWVEFRHASRFLHVHRDRSDPLQGCSVSNCKFSGDYDIATADAVVVHLGFGMAPNVSRRNPYQLWIFWTDESPNNTFNNCPDLPSLTAFSNVFNWSMTYRYESDVPVPYGRTLPLLYPKVNTVTDDVLQDHVPYWKIKRKDKLASVLISNCYPPRINFVRTLNKYLTVDMFGKCSADKHNRRCPGHFRSDCKILSQYLFYIVVENSKCKQYITEKCFNNAYKKGAIPIIKGPPLKDCIELLPPNSFLHADNFETLEHLALEIVAISKNVSKLLSYHAWRNHFEVTNEHGYFGSKSTHLCRICEALNYNEQAQNVYDLHNLSRFLEPKVCCTKFE